MADFPPPPLLSSHALALLAALLGLASHWTYFVHAERDGEAPYILLLFLLVPAPLALLLHSTLHLPVLNSILTGLNLTLCYLLSLSVSILTYRLLLHPLRRIPGPALARLSRWHYAYTQLRTGYQHFRRAEAWHRGYGAAVRVGPNEVSLAHPAALAALANAKKGPWYIMDGKVRNPNLHLSRERETHRVRRRAWDRAFTPTALRGYLPVLGEYSRALVERIKGEAEAAGERGVDITTLFHHYAFDTMGAVCFGSSFNLLSSGCRNGEDRIVREVGESLRAVGLLAPCGWVIRVASFLGVGGARSAYFARFCDECVAKRMQMQGAVRNDLFSYLLAAEAENRPDSPHHTPLSGEAWTAIIAGSDTTASTLTTLILYLAAYPTVQRALHDYIDSSPGIKDEARAPTQEPSASALLHTPPGTTDLLAACINEALRLMPAVSGVQRIVPEGGVEIDGIHVPGGVNACVPQFAVGRDERWYDHPNEFRPSRWTDSDADALARMKSVFHPFWLGPTGCVGKPLALLQLRMAAVQILRTFTVELAPGCSVEKVLDECEDRFTLAMGEVRVVFRRREAEG